MKYRLYDPEFGDMLYGINAKFAKGKNLIRMVFTGLSIAPIDFYVGDIYRYPHLLNMKRRDEICI